MEEVTLKMPDVFSFCLYGSEDNYYMGLLENIKIIKEFYPTFEIFVYKGICQKEWPLKDVNVIYTGREGAINTVFRYLPLGFANTGFVRDADSRITERDRWCIAEFLKSDKKYHIIRDHYWHKSPIMAGMFGWKETLNVELDTVHDQGYSIDEALLKEHVYPLIKNNALVHTNIFSLIGEDDRRIEIPHKDVNDFVGNVIWNNKPKFEYFVDMSAQLSLLQGNDKFALMKYLTDGFDIMSVPYHSRRQIIDAAYICNFYLNCVEKAMEWLQKYEFAEMSDHTITNAEFLIPKMNKRIIASFDTSRKAKENELVIHYGNFPYWHLALPCQSEMYRHISMFTRIRHDVVEYHPAWESVGIIYILNLEERADRYYETLNALAAVGAPLHRVHHYKAKVGDQLPYIGATQNHIDVMKHFQDSEHQRCLILEDDFVFIDDKTRVWESMLSYFSKEYNEDICFLSISKDGEREPVDDLLSRSRQPCTTSSGYFLNKNTSYRVLAVANEGLEKMKESGDHNFCIDRYWVRLPNIYFFKHKLGFQRPAYSNLRRTVISHLD
jgi:hypothetical protein